MKTFLAQNDNLCTLAIKATQKRAMTRKKKHAKKKDKSLIIHKLKHVTFH